MTITSIARPASIQSITRCNSNHKNETYKGTQEQAEQYIYDLIQQGQVFKAKFQLDLINRLNSYIVISAKQFKIWHMEYRKNENSKIKVDKSQSGFSKNQNKQNTKDQNSNNRFQNPQKENQNRNNENSKFQKDFQKAYMELLSR